MSADVTTPASYPLHSSGSRTPGTRHLSEAMPYLTQQYALPIPQTDIHRELSDASLSSGALTPRAENTLRRKTPNGTLNAGYDGSADLSAPPFKHQLIDDASGSFLPQPSLYNGKRTFLQHQQHLQRQGSAYDTWPTPGAQHCGWAVGGPCQSLFPVMDSMLSQGLPPQPYNMQQYYSQTVPSVIQPSFQYLGPTASGGQGSGPYGPYWHDGTYVPYRPAAVRDPRFYHHQHPAAAFVGSLPSSHISYEAGLWQHPSPAHSPWPPMHGPSSLHTPPLHFPVGAQQSQFAPGFVPSGHGIPQPTRYPSITGVQVQPYPPEQFHPPSESAVESEYGSSSPNGRQRDKTFAWALQQYRELLAYIHHTRRHGHQSRHSHGRQNSAQRPSFYPKPPRQSASASSAQLPSVKAEVDSTRNHQEEDPPLSTARADAVSNALRSHSSTPKARSTSVWSPSGIQFHDNEYHRRASYDQYQAASQQPTASLPRQLEKPRTLRRSTGSSVSSLVSPVPADDSPPSRAAAALTYMTKLCQETDWQWTDGMHLGGCLAYGLGNYQKALRWYNKVLERDPRHLEATSNLAATLLALGQRQDAERHWMQVIKVAPNHFEAVEHLVGLLCNDQRSKDAIKVIEYVERCLRQPKSADTLRVSDRHSECSSSTASRSPCISEQSDAILYDFDADAESFNIDWRDAAGSSEPGFASSGFAIPGCDNGRILALIHAKGNMLYGLGENSGAAKAFEDAVLIATGRRFDGIQGLVKHILTIVASSVRLKGTHRSSTPSLSAEPILLSPEQALATAKLCFSYDGELPGLQYVAGGPQSLARKAVISTTSNSLLSLAKILQDGMSNSHRAVRTIPLAHGMRDILALYYLSLSLQPSPSTANNVGILLASVQQAAVLATAPQQRVDIPGVAAGSGIALALQYYNYGLQLDQHHAHLYTNLGSLLKDIGQLDAAINMYERAVKCDGKFDIALANLANAVKDKGRINDAIVYYRRAVEVSPDFAEAVCGLANALNSVCGWQGRGGIADCDGRRDTWHVDDRGMLLDARLPGATSFGWIKRVVDIVEKQLVEGENWGTGAISPSVLDAMVQQVVILEGQREDVQDREKSLRLTLNTWSGSRWEGARVTRLVERATRRIGWYWYRDMFVKKKQRTPSSYDRPQLPASITVPSAPTVLPFHTFTCPMSAKQIRLISQRNGLRISVSTLRSSWLPKQVYPPSRPPAPHLRVGYVSSDFNNHPLAHLMQSVFGMHDPKRAKAYCYATTAGDNSIHRQQIQKEAPVFHDASSWSVERLVNQIVEDGIHILVNLNGYTRGARNEVFAARPAPIQMSFMGFAGTLGAEWCDYLLADETAVPVDTLRPSRRNIDVEDQLTDENYGGENNDWVYGENIIYCRDTFFCCDHKQSAPDAKEKHVTWEQEQKRRWRMRKEVFPQLSDDTIIFGNFNQLYKIDPTTFRTWLRILARVPNSILWLLRFPDLGESHLLATAQQWAGAEVASRVIFTDVAPKHLHISRARVCDLVLDTAECNAHTTAADVLWSGTPLLTLPRYAYKMCSRMAASILKGALPKDDEGRRAALELVATDEDDYEEKAVALGKSLSYPAGRNGAGVGRLQELRKMLFHARWSSALFDTKRWVSDLEDAYDEAWRRWVAGEGGDIWLDRVRHGRIVEET